MIRVERSASPAAPAELDALIERLDAEPGVWMGCDVESEGLFRKYSIACARPAIRFCLDGPRLLVTPFTTDGGRILAGLLRKAPFEKCVDGWTARFSSGRAVLDMLRRFLAGFEPASAELALYGAFSFDYYRLGLDEPLPDDGRRRFVLYFPQQVLEVRDGVAQWIDFRFVADGGTAAIAAGSLAPVSIDIGQGRSPPGAHAKRVAQGVARLREGALHSLVLSQSLRWRTGTRPVAAFRALRARNPYPAMFFCNLGGGEVLLGASPDLQVRADAGCVEAAPVCGTVRRGRDPVDDAVQALGLLASPKESAALALCADAAANDVAAVCEPGSVVLVSHQRPHFFSTIIHAVDHLRGRRRTGTDGFDILLAHATPATVTGLPKPEAVRAICELEEDWRGWYAGAVARVASDGSIEAFTILRAARVADGVAETRVGGNLVIDSDPAAEEEETILKAQTLVDVLDGRAAATAPVLGIPARHRVRLAASEDSCRDRLVNALAIAGADVDHAAAVTVLSGRSREAETPEARVFAVGEGAGSLLSAEGATMERLPAPQFGRPVAGTGTPGGFLASLGTFTVGWYAAESLRADALPPGWRAAALSNDGWVLAAQRDDGSACAVLFRPDSVLSMRDGAGRRAIVAALEWLERRDMFGRISEEAGR